MSGTRHAADFGAAYADAFSSGERDRVRGMYEPAATLQGRDGRRHDGIDAIAAALATVLGRRLRLSRSTPGPGARVTAVPPCGNVSSEVKIHALHSPCHPVEYP